MPGNFPNRADTLKRKDNTMTDHFWTTPTCDRCGGSLAEGRTMSMFNTETICSECKRRETERPDYAAAVKAEREALRRGDRNFPGIEGGNK